MNKQKYSLNKVLKKGIIYLFTWRDALGFYISGIPFRLGEVIAIFYSIDIFKKPKIKGGKELRIILILLINLIFAGISTGLYWNEVDKGFAIKYLIRNVWFLLIIIGFISSETIFSEEDVKKLCFSIVIVQFGCSFISMLSGYHMKIGEIYQLVLGSANYASIGGRYIMRWKGSCVEPGYLAPILCIPTYYYMRSLLDNYGSKRKNIIMLILLMICSIFSFSTAVYGFEILTVIYCVIKTRNQTQRFKNCIIAIVIILIAYFLLMQIPSINLFINNAVIDKIKTYLFYGSGYDASWSGRDRAQHLSNVWKMFLEGNFLQIVIGHGTGGYYYYALGSHSLMIENVSEAYNLFLSSLTDRGIVGFCCLVAIFIYARQLVLKENIASQTIWWGIFMQGVHWMLTGNNWLYYFWFEIMILIGIYKKSSLIK